MNSKNVNVAKLLLFLKDRYSKKGEDITHTLLGPLIKGSPSRGKFTIKDKDQEKFIKLYINVYKDKENLYFVERPKEISPLVIDLDFNSYNKERVYDRNLIKDLVKIFNRRIKFFFNCKDEDINAYIFEKPRPTLKVSKDNEEKEIYKDGIHLIYCDIPLTKEQRVNIYNNSLEYFVKIKFFDNLDIIKENYDKIIDKTVIVSNGLVMYGSKKENYKPYKLTKIYNFNLEELEIPSSFKKTINIVSLRKFINVKNVNYTIRGRKYIKKYEEEKKRINEKSSNIKELINTNNKIINKNKCLIDDKELEKVINMVNIFSLERSSNYDLWTRVCFALKSISLKLYDTFIEFSKKCPEKFNLEVCNKLWESSLHPGFYTEKTIYWWAEKDNKEEYIKLIENDINKVLIKGDMGNHVDISLIVNNFYNNSYICVDMDKRVWYEFQNHRWVKIDNGYTLVEKISTEITNYFLNLQSKYVDISLNTLEPDKKAYNIKKSENIQKIYNKLRNEVFLSNVLKASSRKFFKEGFLDKLDSKPNLLGFNNGVYDLDEGKFRDGIPDDYLSMTVGYDYETYKMDDPLIKEIKDYFKKVQPDKSLRRYLLKLISSFITGRVMEQKFSIWIGEGSNGKSSTIDLMNNTFGDYAGVFPTTILTKKKMGAESATGHLTSQFKKRFITIQEPEYDDKIYIGQLKELTAGNDSMYARGLYEKTSTKSKGQFKLVLICNNLPTISSSASDEAVWRRIRVLPWESRFVACPNNERKNEYLIDRSISEKTEIWKKPFMWLLIQYYKIYKKEGLDEPDKVKIYTKNYRKVNDYYLEYLEDCIIKKDGENISITNIFESFKVWFNINYPNTKIPSRKSFLEYISKDLSGFKLSEDKSHILNCSIINKNNDGEIIEEEIEEE